MERLLDREGSALVREPSGGWSRYGVTQRAFPGVDVAHLSRAEAGRLLSTYKIPGIHNPALAEKVWDMNVNLGRSGSAKVIQRALGDVAQDGAWGPETVASLNRQSPQFMIRIISEQESHYSSQAKRNPKLALYLKGWVARARFDPSRYYLPK